MDSHTSSFNKEEEKLAVTWQEIFVDGHESVPEDGSMPACRMQTLEFLWCRQIYMLLCLCSDVTNFTLQVCSHITLQ
jgi:hypothetical protein